MTDFKGVTVCKTKADYDGIVTKDPDRLYVVENEDLVKLYHNLGQHTDGAVDQKTVTDALDTNQAIFVALYGVTLYSDVTDALDNGKIVIAKDSKRHYTVTYILNGAVSFSSPYSNVNHMVTVHSNDTWTIDTIELQSTVQMVTSLSQSSTDYEYPSAKCVYDAVNGKTLTQIQRTQDIGITSGNTGHCCAITVPKNGVYIISGRINNTIIDSGEVKIGMGEIGGAAGYFAHGVYPDRPSNYSIELSFTVPWMIGGGTTIYLWILNSSTSNINFHATMDVVYMA